jgi:hypothetical protein
MTVGRGCLCAHVVDSWRRPDPCSHAFTQNAADPKAAAARIARHPGSSTKRSAVRRAIGESAEKQFGHARDCLTCALRLKPQHRHRPGLEGPSFPFSATAWSHQARTPRPGSIYIQSQDNRHKKARKVTKRECESSCIFVPLRGHSARQERQGAKSAKQGKNAKGFLWALSPFASLRAVCSGRHFAP